MSLSRFSLSGLTLLVAACGLSADQPTPLGYPVCEPSAALVVPCIGKPGQCLLVGDNETADAVFLYPLGKEGPTAKDMQTIKLGKVEVDDIESMAKLDDKTLLLLGSQSRNSSCEIKDKRRRLMLVRDWGQGPVLAGSLSQTAELSAAALLGGKAASSPVLKAVGVAIDQAEAQADGAAKKKDEAACAAASAFNIEGAVAVPGASGDSKVWIGLRSPLVSYAGKTWAALLRLERPNALGFDQAMLLDLGGRGVRELTLAGDWLWGIAGGPGDAEKNFVLWKVKLGDLQPDAQLHPQILRSLPNSSEGLAFVGGKALVLIDGDRGNDKSKASCQKAGAYLTLDGQ
jgi:hypothetical protein